MRTPIPALVIVIVALIAIASALSIPIFAHTSLTNPHEGAVISYEKPIIAHVNAFIAIPVGATADIGTLTSERDPRAVSQSVLRVALVWIRRGVAIVPVSKTLSAAFDPATQKSKFSPIPTIRWQRDGPLRTEEQVRVHWKSHPEDQLAIVLENPDLKLVCCDVDTKKLLGGVAPEGRPIPQPFDGQYVESSKSGGFHYLAEYTTAIPEWVGGRWTSLGGYVDILARGILFCAPSRFVKPDGSDGGTCHVLTAGPIPVFAGIGEPIARWADWLYPAWRGASERGELPAGEIRVVARKVAPAVTVAEVLERMRQASDAGKIAAWICEHTDGESRDWDLCPKLVVHALEAGANADQATEVVGCPYWTARKVEAIKLTRAAGVQSLLKHTEGQAAFRALRSARPSALDRRIRRYAELPWRGVRDVLGDDP